MTEKEAIEILGNNFPKTCKMVNGRYKGGFDDTECEFGKALMLSISALEEIQQYRAIGTVEECREAIEKQNAKEPVEYEDKYYACPNCDNLLMPKWERYPFQLKDKKNGLPYCLSCGQAILWELQPDSP